MVHSPSMWLPFGPHSRPSAQMKRPWPSFRPLTYCPIYLGLIDVATADYRLHSSSKPWRRQRAVTASTSTQSHWGGLWGLNYAMGPIHHIHVSFALSFFVRLKHRLGRLVLVCGEFSAHGPPGVHASVPRPPRGPGRRAVPPQRRQRSKMRACLARNAPSRPGQGGYRRRANHRGHWGSDAAWLQPPTE